MDVSNMVPGKPSKLAWPSFTGPFMLSCAASCGHVTETCHLELWIAMICYDMICFDWTKWFPFPNFGLCFDSVWFSLSSALGGSWAVSLTLAWNVAWGPKQRIKYRQRLAKMKILTTGEQLKTELCSVRKSIWEPSRLSKINLFATWQILECRWCLCHSRFGLLLKSMPKNMIQKAEMALLCFACRPSTRRCPMSTLTCNASAELNSCSSTRQQLTLQLPQGRPTRGQWPRLRGSQYVHVFSIFFFKKLCSWTHVTTRKKQSWGNCNDRDGVITLQEFLRTCSSTSSIV